MDEDSRVSACVRLGVQSLLDSRLESSLGKCSVMDASGHRDTYAWLVRFALTVPRDCCKRRFAPRAP